MSRVGHALLWVGGFVLAALMTYTVILDLFSSVRRPLRPGDNTALIGVFYPDRTLWREFRQGVTLCLRKRLATLVDEADDAIVIQTPKNGRQLRFELHDVRGLRETKEEAVRFLGRSPTPSAIIGSSNTVLTAEIGDALRDQSGTVMKEGPVLLVPWATAVLTEGLDPSEGPVALLDIVPGRMFRFCPNNQHQADLIVRCVAQREGRSLPGRTVLIVDRHDPYSLDLAGSFHRAIERVAPEAEIVERADSLKSPVFHDLEVLPNLEEETVAESIWRDAERQPSGRTTWVFLPLQDEPSRRMIQALTKKFRPGPEAGKSHLQVICGDALKYSTLSRLAGRCPFPVWCSSSASAPAAAEAVGEGHSPDTQIPAEIVSALIYCLDTPWKRSRTGTTLRSVMASLHFAPDEGAAMGRSLAFSRSGERTGDDLGHVFMIRPDSPGVFSLSRLPTGQWSVHETHKKEPVVFQP
ncbi:MAG: hypothetical protein NVSMB9_24220 [Isosphaeraceae bacterium]